MRLANPLSPLADADEEVRDQGPATLDLTIVRVFVVALGALLLGYMFMGRGFAHLGVRPVYVGEVVLAFGFLATGVAVMKLRLRYRPTLPEWLLIAFMALGAARTIPYLPQYGIDALRDAVLWGYGFFALFIVVLADRRWVTGALRAYGWVVPVFALWLPISWNLFRMLSVDIDPANPGRVVPLIFFKSGDMAVHTMGAVAFIVLGTIVVATLRDVAIRATFALPLTWTIFATGTTNRGSLVTSIVGLGLTALLAGRSRNWLPVGVAGLVLVVLLSIPGLVPPIGPEPGETPIPTATPVVPSPTPTTEPTPTPAPTPPVGRDTSIGQFIENFVSIFVSSANAALEGTRQFRIQWWLTIVDYTVFGPHFWGGKGFGVNLADDDGFQPTADRSLRAPHNSHMTALARMGVPGFVLWIVLQLAFFVALVRAILVHRRSGGRVVATAGGILLVYWLATMANTSFDPYLEGPQGGIWFWCVFGLGLVVIRLARARVGR